MDKVITLRTKLLLICVGVSHLDQLNQVKRQLHYSSDNDTHIAVLPGKAEAVEYQVVEILHTIPCKNI